ncbi:hypothetical protein [Sphaerisporangium flaviroseum]|uniref:hypothetical protein n=1 Tax=Sphaerisporangium flaviroseum TaxID=509199 RepID=UPI0031ED7D00
MTKSQISAGSPGIRRLLPDGSARGDHRRATPSRRHRGASRWPRDVLVLLMCLSALGCGLTGGDSLGGDPGGGSSTDGSSDDGSTGGDSSDGDSSGRDPGALGEPGDGGNGSGKEGLGSPIDIPEITVSQGQPVAQVRTRLEAGIRTACGNGELCVNLQERKGDNDVLETCEFDTTDPAPGTKVARKTTVWIVTGALPCTDDSTPDGEGQTPDGEQTPDGGEQTPDGGEQTPDGGEQSPDTGQGEAASPEAGLPRPEESTP